MKHIYITITINLITFLVEFFLLYTTIIEKKLTNLTGIALFPCGDIILFPIIFIVIALMYILDFRCKSIVINSVFIYFVLLLLFYIIVGISIYKFGV